MSSRMTNIEIRRENRRQIYRYICRHSVTSNPEISYECRLSLPTVTQNTRELIELGLVCESGELASTGGRKAKALSATADFRYAAGVEITRNHIAFVLSNIVGEMIRFERQKYAFANTEEYYQGAAKRLEKFLETYGIENEKLLGIGVVIPGIVDHRQKMITDSYTLRMRNVSFVDIEKYFKHPCYFLNDANAGAFAERLQSEEKRQFFYLSLSNSVGGALYSDGTLMYGDHYRCGEVGHMTLVPDGLTCYCGKSGCMDSYCSAKCLADRAGGVLENYFSFLEKDQEELDHFRTEYLKYLSITVNNLHMVMDCDIVLGGYVGSYLGPYLQEIRRQVEERNTFCSPADYVKLCEYKVEAAAMGAALYIIESYVKQI